MIIKEMIFIGVDMELFLEFKRNIIYTKLTRIRVESRTFLLLRTKEIPSSSPRKAELKGNL